jgi:hypothetical protein
MGFQTLSLVELKDDANESHNLANHAITLAICNHCTHVHNLHFNPAVVAYDAAGCRMFNNGSNWQDHVEHVRTTLHGIDNLDLIVEIGAGDCEFLASLKTQATRLAVDPCEDVERAEELGLLYDRSYFSAATHIPEGSQDTLVIMRHVLEHLEKPRELLEPLANYARNRDCLTWVYVEVPSCENALKRSRIEDWTYEHPQNFTVKSMTALFHACGLDYFMIEPSYGNEVLSCLIKISPKQTHIDDVRVNDVLAKYRRVRHGLNEEAQWLREHRHEVTYWGGAGKSAMFLNLFDVPDDSAVVDSHDAKWGMYVPGTKIKILNPDCLKYWPAGYIVATTAWRANDIRDEINQRGIPCKALYKFENGILMEVPLGNQKATEETE